MRYISGIRADFHAECQRRHIVDRNTLMNRQDIGMIICHDPQYYGLQSRVIIQLNHHGDCLSLCIIMKWENNRISLFIRNSIPELSAEDEALRKSVDERQRKGIGLVNLRRRLSLLYPNKHRLETRKEETEFVAELMIEIEDI